MSGGGGSATGHWTGRAVRLVAYLIFFVLLMPSLKVCHVSCYGSILVKETVLSPKHPILLRLHAS